MWACSCLRFPFCKAKRMLSIPEKPKYQWPAIELMMQNHFTCESISDSDEMKFIKPWVIANKSPLMSLSFRGDKWHLASYVYLNSVMLIIGIIFGWGLVVLYWATCIVAMCGTILHQNKHFIHWKDFVNSPQSIGEFFVQAPCTKHTWLPPEQVCMNAAASWWSKSLHQQQPHSLFSQIKPREWLN